MHVANRAHGYEQIEHESLFRTAAHDLGTVESALRAWLDGQA